MNKRLYRCLIMKFILITYLADLLDSYQKTEFLPVQYRGITPIVWVDGRNREPETEIDTFFDRALVIFLKLNKSSRKNEHETTGVLIKPNQVLTAYNPFVILSKDEKNKELIDVSFVHSRLFTPDSKKLVSYYVRHRKVVCARPVVPLRDKEPFPKLMRHGPHSPIHDLMVLRLNESIELHHPFGSPPEPVHEFTNIDLSDAGWDVLNKAYHIRYGAVLTEISAKNDSLDYPFKFASLGHINDDHIKDGRYLEKEEFYQEDDVIADCDEVIPREWGRFICIKNIYDYAGLASGGLLFTGDKLIGMGSFAVFKGKLSYLIFTDLRLYRYLIFETCTLNEHNRVKEYN